MNKGFPQALYMARAALQYMNGVDDDGNPDPRSAGQESYNRYFAPESRRIVMDALMSFFKDKPEDGVASEDFNKVTMSLNGPLGLQDPTVVCGGGLANVCSSSNYLAALIRNCNGISGVPETASDDYALMVVCLNAFIGWADLPPWILPTGTWATCKLFENGQNYAQHVARGQKGMDTLAASIFHEVLHFRHLFRNSVTDLSRRKITDYWAKNDPTNSAQQPQNGYGPWNTFQLREMLKIDPNMDVNTPAFNADSYTWFAL